ncbi:hypothetical protein I7I48_10314 [Histoplasma ohiense]|nr:hypothetical protein I7I48_10314 [Histoplasma ohiense (nom. inval.)]
MPLPPKPLIPVSLELKCKVQRVMVAPCRLRLYSVLQGVRVAGWMCMVITVWKCGRVVIDFGWRLSTWGMDEGG